MNFDEKGHAVVHRINKRAGGAGVKKQKEIECTVEFTEGAIDRITDAFVDLYYQIEDGIYKGPLPPKQTEETA